MNFKLIFFLSIIFLFSSPITSSAQSSHKKKLSIKGYIKNESVHQNHIKLTIMWQVDDEGSDRIEFSKIAVQPSKSKNTFKTKIAPPSEKAMMKVGDCKLAIGYIVAFADANENNKMESEEIIGAAPDHCIVFLDGNLEAFAKAQDPQKLFTLLKLNQGLQLTKKQTPKEHQLPSRFDDLIPVKKATIQIRIPKNKTDIKIPNWT